MSQEDRIRWDARYVDKEPATTSGNFPLPLFASLADQFPNRGRALEIACGRGEAATWFARQGMAVYGVDVSPEAIRQARELASATGLSKRCRFEVFDLDAGLPDTPPVDLLVCHNFRSPDLYNTMQERLAPGGLLAIVTLSEVGDSPGRFRSTPGELDKAFSTLEKVFGGEGDGRAWLLARKT